MRYNKRTMNKLTQYKKLLPEKLTLEIRKSKDGLWAKVKELPHCYTQAKNFPDLLVMINDAIYTYLKIPVRYKDGLGMYLPKEFVEELTRRKWERALKELTENVSRKENLKLELTA